VNGFKSVSRSSCHVEGVEGGGGVESSRGLEGIGREDCSALCWKDACYVVASRCCVALLRRAIRPARISSPSTLSEIVNDLGPLATLGGNAGRKQSVKGSRRMGQTDGLG